MSVGRRFAYFKNIFESINRPARTMFIPVCPYVRQFVHIGPALVPVSPQGHKGAFRNGTVFFFIGFDIFHSYGIINVNFYLFADINHCQREHKVLYTVLFRQGCIFHKMPREINMSAELTGEFERMNQAFQHGIAPVKNHLAQFHRTFRYSAPERTVVVEGMGKFYPLIPFRFQFL